VSLIESAIKRARARAGKDPQTPTKSGLPRPPPPVAVPAERIPAMRLAVDPAVCSEHRILLDGWARDNERAVAAFRILRTRLLQRARLQQWTFIGITSASVNDGKSLTALNLALSLSRERNTEVVLLDLDMRNPSICRYLGVNPPHSLRDYFEQRITADELFFSIGVEKLLFASGKVTTESASELLGTRLLGDLKEYIRQRTMNPIVLIDLPPLLHTDDALVVAPSVDALVLIAAEGHTDRVALNKALELIGEFPLAGLVLTRTIEASRQFEYGYGLPRT
jgi:Mrp family chromosome partitioning ATPase